MSSRNYPLTESMRSIFLQQGVKIKYKRGQLFDRPHDSSQGVYYLEDGQTLVYVTNMQGLDKNIAIFEKGATFSKLGNMLGISPISSYIEALTDCLVYRISMPQFFELLKENEFCMAWIRQHALNNFYLIDHISLFGERNTYGRFINWLLFMHKYYGNASETGSTLRVVLTQEQIANFLGVTREHIGSTLRKVQKEGLISSVNGAIRINDLDKLKFLSGFEEFEIPEE